MNINSIYSIFALLKVVRTGDLEQQFLDTTIKSKRIRFRPARQSAYLCAFFYCAIMKYNSTKYSTKVYLPLQLIQDAVDNNWLESLIYYVWMKKLHTKPIIYNFSLRKIGAA